MPIIATKLEVGDKCFFLERNRDTGSFNIREGIVKLVNIKVTRANSVDGIPVGPTNVSIVYHITQLHGSGFDINENVIYSQKCGAINAVIDYHNAEIAKLRRMED